MWLIRTHKLQPKDYNYIKRVFDKIWFFPKRISWIIFVKALFFHILQKKSWRNIATILNCSHLAIYNFFSNYKKYDEIKEIFFYFSDRRIIVFIEDKKTFSNDDLDNNDDFLEGTKKELEEILESLD